MTKICQSCGRELNTIEISEHDSVVVINPKKFSTDGVCANPDCPDYALIRVKVKYVIKE